MNVLLVKITLTEDQGRQFDQTGSGAFAIVSRGSYPTDAGRWILTLAAVEWDNAPLTRRLDGGILTANSNPL